MKEFLTRFSKAHRNGPSAFLLKAEEIFTRTIEAIESSLGERAFRPERTLNAAVFDSVMIGVARLVESGKQVDAVAIRESFAALLADVDYIEATSKATSDKRSVTERLSRAVAAFSTL